MTDYTFKANDSPLSYYVGDFREDALNGNHRGWFVGIFMEAEPCKTNHVELKYWEYEVGNPNHPAKVSSTLECTLILEGQISGEVDGETVHLSAGQYVVIPPGTKNALPKAVVNRVRGLTIKAPSDPTAKRVVE